MPEHRRPSLLNAHQVEVSEHLLSKGIESSIRKDATAMLITIEGTSDDLNAAMADFANIGSYRSPLPTAIQTHTQHLIDFRSAVRAGTFGAGMTATQRRDQTEHVLADVIDAIRLMIDDRLG